MYTYRGTIQALDQPPVSSSEDPGAHHHLVAELVVEGVGEEAGDRGQAVHHVERQAAVVAQHHQQGAHVSVDLVHLDGGTLQELQAGTGSRLIITTQIQRKTISRKSGDKHIWAKKKRFIFKWFQEVALAIALLWLWH